MKKILIFALILLYVFRLWQSTGCKNYINSKFDALSVKIRVEEQVGLDTHTDRQISRFFHNKITTGFFEFANDYASHLEPKTLTSILGPAGLIFILLALISIKSKFSFAKFVHIAIVLAALLVVTLLGRTKTSFYLSSVALYSFSLQGLGHIKINKTSFVIFLALIIISFFYFSFNWQMAQICNEIFFN